ncbi:hypothetical protein BgiMline_015735 [Biomphalaria glabrata]|nr:hypothetical protein BgiMline_008555 [Biomphalaria glabrata]
MTQTDYLGTSMVSRGQQRPTECSKEHPSVLHLLPFSNNNAADDVSHTTPKDVPKSSSAENRVFPVLAVTRSLPTHTQLSEGFEPNDKNVSANQKRRYLRVSSEKLSRHQARARARAKSEYEIRANIKPSTATFYIKSDNELDVRASDNTENTQNCSLSSSSLKTDHANGNTSSKTRSVQKSLMSLYDLQKRGHITSFWHKKELSSIESKQAKTQADQTSASTAPFSNTVKMNVKELPRSKTPLVENDPDKLNMNHVIAFLQNTEIDSRASDKKKEDQNISLKTTKKPIAYDPDFGSQTKSAVQLNQRQNTTLLGSTNEQSKPATVESNVYRFPDFRPQSYPSYRVDLIKKNGADKKQNDSQQKPRNLHYSDLKTYNSIMSAQPEQRARPESLRWRVSSDQQGEINISTMIRNISNNTGVNNASGRPFRLHRFLTIVPDRLPNVETKDPGSAESKSNAVVRGGTAERPVIHITSTISKDKGGDVNNQEHVPKENRGFDSLTNLAINRLIKESPRRKPHSTIPRRGSHFSGMHYDAPAQFNGTRKKAVICLPSAEYDLDEDELPVYAPARENTRASFKQPTQTHLYEANTEHGELIDLPIASSIGGQEIETDQEMEMPETETQDVTSLTENISGEKMDVFNKSDTQSDFKLHPVDFTALVTHDQEQADDVYIHSSLFLNYPSPSLSHHSSYAATTPKVDFSKTQQKESGHFFPSHKNLKSHSSSSTHQTFTGAQVKLTLRKERDRTSALTYMSDMEVL